ncbi:MAG: hypothetical protein CSA65_01195 [Proteobacteria bacterium]|nr:MAG: hypothetical protein CSA65_01195 [Pseudomonadota bacterium]
MVAFGLALGVSLDVAAKARWTVRVELGPELDTNPARVTDEDQDSYDGASQTAAPLFRLVTSSDLVWTRGSHRLVAALGGGGKLHLTDDGRLSDELVGHGSLAWTVFGAVVGWRLEGQYYDVFLRQPVEALDCGGLRAPCPPPRDFRSGRVSTSLLIGRGATRGTLSVGYTGLEFKRDRAFSHHGFRLGVQLWQGFRVGRGDAITDWGLVARYVATARFFGGLGAVAAPCADRDAFDCVELGDFGRRDLNHQASFALDYLGGAAARLFYTLEINRSNSVGESYTRHAIGMQFTAPLVLGVFMTARLVIQLSSFDDALFSEQVQQASVNIDIENRSRLLLHFGFGVEDSE